MPQPALEPRAEAGQSLSPRRRILTVPSSNLHRVPSKARVQSPHQLQLGPSAFSTQNPQRMQSTPSTIALQSPQPMPSVSSTFPSQTPPRRQTSVSRVPSADNWQPAAVATQDRGPGQSPRSAQAPAPPQLSLASQKEVLNGALEHSIAVLKAGPQAYKESVPPQQLLRGPVDVNSARAEEVLAALAALQANLEQQQGEQRNLIATLTAQWEQRFASVLQCLKTTTNTAASMNERSAKFLRLGEVLEGALDQMSSDHKDVSSLSQKVGKMEASVGWLSEEVAAGRADRARILEEAMHCAGGQEQGAAEHAGGAAGAAPCGEGGRDAAKDWPRSDVERLAWQLGEEAAERRKLAREVHCIASDAAALRERLETASDQVLRLSRQLSETRGEVRQVAGELSRAWGADISSDSNLRAELRSEFAQRLDSLGRELRGELAVRTATAGLEAATSAPATAREAPRQGAAGAAGRAQAAPRVEPLRKDLVNEIAAAMAGV